MSDDRVDRRLAAIVAVDVAGYSRLIETDEEGTLNRLKACRKVNVDPKITGHRGRTVETTRNGMLMEFVSVVDAVGCAVDIQRGMPERDADSARLRHRAGTDEADASGAVHRLDRAERSLYAGAHGAVHRRYA